jgi:hypothetical protein
MTKIKAAGRWLWNAAIHAATDATWVLVTVLELGDSEEDRTGNLAALARQSNTLQDMVGRATSTLDAIRYRTLIARTRTEAFALVGLLRSEVDRDVWTAEQGRGLFGRVQSAMEPLRDDIQTINDLKRKANSRGLRAVRIQLRVSLGTTIAILIVSVGVRLFIYRSQRRVSRKGARR